MLTLSHLEVFTWEAIFIKMRQVYLAVVRSEIAFEASVVMIESTRWIDEIYKSDMTMWYSKQAQNKYILW